MKGIDIVFNGYRDARISKILIGIPVDNYTITVDDSMIYDGDNTIDCGGVVNYFDIIKIQNSCMIMNMSLYIGNGTINTKGVETYEDFISSNCDIIILIHDCIFYEIYSKSELYIYKILKNLDRMNAREISIKTDSTDTRTRMFV